MELKCKHCKDRATGEKDCHATCENYNAWKKEQAKIKERIRKAEEERRIDSLIRGSHFGRHRR